jgi:hypothetical protein
MNVLRPRLLPGLLDALRHNISRKNGDVSDLFEIGRVFVRAGSDDRRRPKEESARGHRPDRFLRAPALPGAATTSDAMLGATDLKGVVEDLLRAGRPAQGMALRQARGAARRCSSKSAGVALGGKLALGELGQLLPALAKQIRPARRGVSWPSCGLDALRPRPAGTPAKSVQAACRSSRPAGRDRGDARARGDDARRRARRRDPAGQAGEPGEPWSCSTSFRGKHMPDGREGAWPTPSTYRAATVPALEDKEVAAARALGRELQALAQSLAAGLVPFPEDNRHIEAEAFVVGRAAGPAGMAGCPARRKSQPAAFDGLAARIPPAWASGPASGRQVNPHWPRRIAVWGLVLLPSGRPVCHEPELSGLAKRPVRSRASGRCGRGVTNATTMATQKPKTRKLG